MDRTETGTPERPSGEERERRRRSPVLALSLLGSAIAHVLLVVLYPVWMGGLRPGFAPPLQPEVSRPEGTEIVAIREVAADAEVSEPEAEPPDPEPVPERPPAGPVESPRAPEAEAPAPTPAERLRPNEDNTRLWVPVDRALTDLTPEERLQLEIDMAIDAWNDSVGSAAERARAATDWTTTDEDGNRWGVSPGKIHLGKVTLPLPFNFGPANGLQRDELAKRAFELGDIDRAASQGLVRETLKERAAAIRERRDAERASDRAARAVADGETGDAPPDTTRIRR